MSISTIGNTYSYVYNFKTKKLSTTDGTVNDFVKYFNGEIEGYESKTLNGFDKQRKEGFENVLSLLEEGGFWREKIAEDTVFEISGKNIDGDTIEYSINGEKYLTCHVTPSLTYSEYLECSKIWNSGEAYACTNNDGWTYPDAVYNRVLKRYEDWLYQPLSEASDVNAYRESIWDTKNNAMQTPVSYDNGRAIGVVTVGKIGYIARYADSSTPTNPVIKVGDYEVRVKDVDPRNATELEMFALLSYLDDTCQTNNSGMNSFSKLRSFSDLAEQNGLCDGIKDADTFYSKKQNWMNIIGDVREIFMGNSQTYKQVLDCNNLLDFLQNYIEEMLTKIEAGDVDNEPAIQIGANEYTQEEWDKLLEHVDEVEEEIREAMELEQEKALEETLEEIKFQAEQIEKEILEKEALKDTAANAVSHDAVIQNEAIEDMVESKEEEISLIEKSEGALLTYEYVGCKYTNDEAEGKDWNYITWFTEEGMFCKDVNGHVGNNWAFFWENEEQYHKVMGFVNLFSDDYNMRFASNQTFWKDFLNDEIDMEGFMAFLATTNNGVPNYGIGDAENIHIDREKVQWAKYLNQPGLFRPLTRVDELGFPYPDKEYIDEQTGFRWNVNGDGEPYMLGNWKEDFYRHCERTGADPAKKFAELTGILQYLPDGSYAYIGSNAISIKSPNGEKLVLKKEDMTYDMLMHMFDYLPETDNFFDLTYWEENMVNAKEAIPKEIVVKL